MRDKLHSRLFVPALALNGTRAARFTSRATHRFPQHIHTERVLAENIALQGVYQWGTALAAMDALAVADDPLIGVHPYLGRVAVALDFGGSYAGDFYRACLLGEALHEAA